MKDRDGVRLSGEGPDHDTIVLYLLGRLPEDERARLEEQYFRDDGAFEHVLAVEDELLHDYAQGGLTAEDRRRFEERLLRTPEGQARLSRARALLAELPGSGVTVHAHRRSVVRVAGLAAAAVVALALAGWLAIGRERSGVDEAQGALPPSVAPGLRPTPGPSPDAVVPSPGVLAARVVMLALAPGLSRAETPARRVVLPPGVSTLRLELGLPKERATASYRARLSSAEGAEVWSGAATPDGRDRLAVDIAAERVPEGDYELVLTRVGKAGPAEVASYAFGVLRE
jgi:hypothetical protein